MSRDADDFAGFSINRNLRMWSTSAKCPTDSVERQTHVLHETPSFVGIVKEFTFGSDDDYGFGRNGIKEVDRV